MLNKLAAIGTILGLFACGDDVADDYTWGEITYEVSLGFCAAMDRCGTNVDVELCADHNRWHLCEARRNCDVAVTSEGAEEAVEVCVDALAEVEPGDAECTYLLYGVGPKACEDVWTLEPESPE